MAITFDSSNNAFSESTSPVTVSHTIGGGSGRIAVATIGIEGNAADPQVSAVTYDGVSCTVVVAGQTGTTGFRNYSGIYAILDTDLPGAGTYNLSVTWAVASSPSIVAGVASWDGVDQTIPSGAQIDAASDTGFTVVTTPTVATADSLSVTNVSSGIATTFTPPTGYTEDYDYQPGAASSSMAMAYMIEPTATALSLTFTSALTANRLQMTAAIFAPVSAGGNTLVADSAAYVYSVTDADLLQARILSADSAAFAYSATDANLAAGFALSADSASYAYSVADAGLVAGLILAADSAAYLYSVTDADLLAGYVLDANSAAYSYLTPDATLIFSPAGDFTLIADSAAYSYLVTDAALLRASILVADSATYTYSGTDVTLSVGFSLTADSAAYAYVVTDADLIVGGDATLIADSAAYIYTAANVTLTASGFGVFGLVVSGIIDAQPIAAAGIINDSAIVVEGEITTSLAVVGLISGSGESV